MHGLNEAAVVELEELRASAGGFLKPADIVERARSANSALHRYFEWDDSEAAEAYRIQQARTVIRAVVQYLPAANGHPIAVRAYTSLASDRTTHEGYRATVDVLDDEAATAAAMRELQRAVTALRAKYGAWAALRPALDQMLAAVENVGAM